MAATGTAPFRKSSANTSTPHVRPRTRPAFVAPMFPLPVLNRSTPFSRPTRYPNGIAPTRYAARTNSALGRFMSGRPLRCPHLGEHSQQRLVVLLECPRGGGPAGGLAGGSPV